MKKNNFMKALAATVVAALFLTACDPEGTAQRNYLGQILYYSEDPNLSVDQLMDSIKAYNDAGGPQMLVPFTLTDIDTQPRDGRQINTNNLIHIIIMFCIRPIKQQKSVQFAHSYKTTVK